MRRFVCVWSLASACVFAWACPCPSYGQDAPASQAAAAKEGETLKLADGRILVTKPVSWRTVKPKFNIIQYEFQAPLDAKETARITVSSATGGVEANVKRWISQFEGLTESDVDVVKKEIDKTTVHLVELDGTYKDSMGGPAAGGPVKKLENYAMLSAILELQDGSTVFIKMTGPKQVVAEEKKAFMAMIDGLKNK
jgi:hypothetical protein